MTKVAFFGGLTVLMLCALSACSEVDNCKRGEPGCVDGPPEDGACKFGLEVSGGKCVEPGTGDGDGSGDGDGGDGSDGDAGAPPACDCPDGQLCDATGACINFCEVPERLPGSEAGNKPEPVPCFKADMNAPDLTFNEACLRRCKNTAQRQSWFCESAPVTCAEDDAAMLLACTTDCPGNDIMCLQQACEAVRMSGCNDTVCTSGMPNCAGVRCNNDCAKRYLGDGWCDDGDTFGTSHEPGTDDSAFCAWGTDCADCGPRRGDDVPDELPIGAQCHWNSRCAGYEQKLNDAGDTVADLKDNRAWCARLEQPVVGNYRCVLDASGAGEVCPEGYATVSLRNADGSLMMDEGLQAKACIPPDNFCE